MWLPLAGIGMVSAAHGVQYHTTESVQRLLFPQAQSFAAQTMLLTPVQRNHIEQAANVKVRDAKLNAWEVLGPNGRQGWLLIDEVLGKHDLITYAVALNAQGTILGIEIMTYRETYGGQINDARWRDQFKGKTTKDALKIETDIQNISGATLSCQHVTDGVRRLVSTWQMALASQP